MQLAQNYKLKFLNRLADISEDLNLKFISCIKCIFFESYDIL